MICRCLDTHPIPFISIPPSQTHLVNGENMAGTVSLSTMAVTREMGPVRANNILFSYVRGPIIMVKRVVGRAVGERGLRANIRGQERYQAERERGGEISFLVVKI